MILDYVKGKETCKIYNINSMPGFYVFNNGRFITEYIGLRTVDEMGKYIKRIIATSIDKLETDQMAFDSIHKEEISVILCDSSDNEDLHAAFSEKGEELKYFAHFAHATTDDAIKVLNPREIPGILLIRNVDDFRDDLDADNVENLTNIVLKIKNPRYNNKNGVIIRDLMADSRLSIVSFVDKFKKSSMKAMHKNLKSATKEFGNNFTYIYFDVNEEMQMAKKLGFSGSKNPIFCIANFTYEHGIIPILQYHEDHVPDPSTFSKFILNFMESRNMIPLKSEEIESPLKGPLKKLVGSNFRDAINEYQYDIVTLFNTGDDAKIRRATSMLHTIAKEYYSQRVTTFKFYYIDIDKNDLPGVKKPKIYEPTFIIWPAGKKRQPFLIPNDYTTGELMLLFKQKGHTNIKFTVPEKYDL